MTKQQNCDVCGFRPVRVRHTHVSAPIAGRRETKVTLYCRNCWQARSLREWLQRRGIEVA
jgi:hypothetical protein